MTLTETIKKMSPKSAFTYFDNKLKYEVGPVELKRRMDDKEMNFELIDVRSREAYDSGHIPGAKMIPFEEFRMRMPEFSASWRIRPHAGWRRKVFQSSF
jgi:rhodanese-related sulfurtransferase